jgi:hypothetical protein
MFWLSMKYLPNSYEPSKHGQVLTEVFNLAPIDSPLTQVPSSNHGTLHNCGNDGKANWMANSWDVNYLKVTGNDPLSCLLLSLKNMLRSQHVSPNMVNAVLDPMDKVHSLK